MPAIFRAHGALPQWIGEWLLPPFSHLHYWARCAYDASNDTDLTCTHSGCPARISSPSNE